MDEHILNHELRKLEIKKHMNVIRSYPDMVIYVDDRCNSRCIFCVDINNNKQPANKLSIENYKKLMKNCRFEFIDNILYAGGGEPLLNSDLFEIISITNKNYPHIKKRLYTNGIFMDNTAGESLISSGINEVIISINASSRSTYKKVMQVDMFDYVYENIKRLSEVSRGYKNSITIKLSMVILMENIYDLKNIVSLCRDAGAHGIIIQYARFSSVSYRKRTSPDFDKLNENSSLFYHQRISDQYVTYAVDMARCSRIKCEHEPLFSDTGYQRLCDWPWKGIVVDTGGFVSPCCGSEIFLKERSNGNKIPQPNLFYQHIDNWWNGELFVNLRKTVNTGKPYMKECLVCPYCLYRNKDGLKDRSAHFMEYML